MGGVIALALILTGPLAPLAEAGMENSFWENRRERVKHQHSLDSQDQNVAADGQAFRLTFPPKSTKAPPAFAPPNGTGLSLREYFPLQDKPGPFPIGSNSLPFIIHIQDAHGNLTGQQSLVRILNDLADQNPSEPLFIAVEGAWGPLPIDWFQIVPDTTWRSAWASDQLTRGELTGEEAFALGREKGQVKIVGVDDPFLYRQNRLAQGSVERFRDPYLERIRSLRHIAPKLIKKYFPPPLQTAENAFKDHRAERSSLPSTLERVYSLAPPTWWSKNFPALERFHNSILNETRSTTDIEQEITRFCSLPGRDPTHVRSLTLLLAQVRNNQRNPQGEEIGPFLSPDLAKQLPHLARRLAILDKARSIHPPELWAEWERLEPALVTQLMAGLPSTHRSEVERVRKWVRGLDGVETVVSLQATPAQWEEYKQGPSFDLERTEREGRDLARQAGTVLSLPHKPRPTETARREAERFYLLAEARNRPLVLNTLSAAQGVKRVILITGGFHSQEMERHLRRQGASYVTLTPDLSEENPRPTLRAESGMNGSWNAAFFVARELSERRITLNRENALTPQLSRISLPNGPHLSLVGPYPTRTGGKAMVGSIQTKDGLVPFYYETTHESPSWGTGRKASAWLANSPFSNLPKEEALKIAAAFLGRPLFFQKIQEWASTVLNETLRLISNSTQWYKDHPIAGSALLTGLSLGILLYTGVGYSHPESLMAVFFPVTIEDHWLSRLLNPRPPTVEAQDLLWANTSQRKSVTSHLIELANKGNEEEATLFLRNLLAYSDERAAEAFLSLSPDQRSSLFANLPPHVQGKLHNSFPAYFHRRRVDAWRDFEENLNALVKLVEGENTEEDITDRVKTSIEAQIGFLEDQHRLMSDIYEKPGRTPTMNTQNGYKDKIAWVGQTADQKISRLEQSLSFRKTFLSEIGSTPVTVTRLKNMISNSHWDIPSEQIDYQDERLQFSRPDVYLLNRESHRDWIRAVTGFQQMQLIRELPNADLSLPMRRAARAMDEREKRELTNISSQAAAFLESPDGQNWDPTHSPFHEILPLIREIESAPPASRKTLTVLPDREDKEAFLHATARVLHQTEKPIRCVYVDPAPLITSLDPRVDVIQTLNQILSDARQREDVALFLDLDPFQAEDVGILKSFLDAWSKEASQEGPPLPALHMVCTDRTFQTRLDNTEFKERLGKIMGIHDSVQRRQWTHGSLERLWRKLHLGESIPSFDSLLAKITTPLDRTETAADILRRAAAKALLDELHRRAPTEVDPQYRRSPLAMPLTATNLTDIADHLPPLEIRPLRERVIARMKVMPPDQADNAREALSQLESRRSHTPNDPEIQNLAVYLETLLSFPWVEEKKLFPPGTTLTSPEGNRAFAELLTHVMGVLDKSHAGLGPVKDMIPAFLTQMALREISGADGRKVLCLIGPPGVGKTTIARSIAVALELPIQIIPGNILSSPEDLKGTLRTYRQSGPGMIVRGMIEGDPDQDQGTEAVPGVKNTVMVIDEVDKATKQMQADLSALIDPENPEFSDNFAGPVPSDRINFIFTGNILSNIQSHLRDRMDVILLPGYTREEKISIGSNVLKKIKSQYALPPYITVWNERDFLEQVVDGYDREEGVRYLERLLENTMKKALVEWIKTGDSVSINRKKVREYLGPPLRREWIPPQDRIGEAYTPSGTQEIGVAQSFLNSQGDNSGLRHRPILFEAAKRTQTLLQAHGSDWIRILKPQDTDSEPTPFSQEEIRIDVPLLASTEDPDLHLAMTVSALSQKTGRPIRREAGFIGSLDHKAHLRKTENMRRRAVAAWDFGTRILFCPAPNRTELFSEVFDMVPALRGPVVQPENNGEALLILPGHFLPTIGPGNPTPEWSAILERAKHTLTVAENEVPTDSGLYAFRGTLAQINQLAHDAARVTAGEIRATYVLSESVDQVLPMAFRSEGMEDDYDRPRPTEEPAEDKNPTIENMEKDKETSTPPALETDQPVSPSFLFFPRQYNFRVFNKPKAFQIDLRSESSQLDFTQLRNYLGGLGVTIQNVKTEEDIADRVARLESLCRYLVVSRPDSAGIVIYTLYDMITGTKQPKVKFPEIAKRILNGFSAETLGLLVATVPSLPKDIPYPKIGETYERLEQLSQTLKTNESLRDEELTALIATLQYGNERIPISPSDKKNTVEALDIAIEWKEKPNQSRVGPQGLQALLRKVLLDWEPMVFLLTNESFNDESLRQDFSELFHTAMEEHYIIAISSVLESMGQSDKIPLMISSYQGARQFQDQGKPGIAFTTFPASPLATHPLDPLLGNTVIELFGLMNLERNRMLSVVSLPNRLKPHFAPYLAQRLWTEGLPRKVVKLDPLRLRVDDIDSFPWRPLLEWVKNARDCGNMVMWIDLDELTKVTRFSPRLLSRIITVAGQGDNPLPLVFTATDATHRRFIEEAPAYGQVSAMTSLVETPSLSILEAELALIPTVPGGLKFDDEAQTYLTAQVKDTAWSLGEAESVIDRGTAIAKDQGHASILRTDLEMAWEKIHAESTTRFGKLTFEERFALVSPRMPRHVREKAAQLLAQLRKAGPDEKAGLEAQLDALLSLPYGVRSSPLTNPLPDNPTPEEWEKHRRDSNKVRVAFREEVDKTHYGLDSVKELVEAYLAIQMNARARGKKSTGKPILLVSDPGLGKSTFGHSMAHALGRKFFKLRLGGLSNIHILVGFFAGFMGATFGKFAEGLIKTGQMDFVCLLDEIDKMEPGQEGNPYNVLLSVLDPSQNSRFKDLFATVGVDLSEVVFLATANTLDTIPAPLLDRFEVVRLTSPNEEATVVIGARYVLRDLQKNWKTEDFVSIPDPEGLVRTVMPKEGGIRRLKDILQELLLRATGDAMIKGEKVELSIELAQERAKALPSTKNLSETHKVGHVWGLAVRGGQEGVLLEIDSQLIPQNPGQPFRVEGTGLMGQDMAPSYQRAKNYALKRAQEINSELSLDGLKGWALSLLAFPFNVKKDGDSAGVAFALASLSALTGKPIRQDVTMTGSIDENGNVSKIGGLDAKILTALDEGANSVLIPDQNQNDLATFIRGDSDPLWRVDSWNQKKSNQRESTLYISDALLEFAQATASEDLEKDSETKWGLSFERQTGKIALKGTWEEVNHFSKHFGLPHPRHVALINHMRQVEEICFTSPKPEDTPPAREIRPNGFTFVPVILTLVVLSLIALHMDFIFPMVIEHLKVTVMEFPVILGTFGAFSFWPDRWKKIFTHMFAPSSPSPLRPPPIQADLRLVASSAPPEAKDILHDSLSLVEDTVDNEQTRDRWARLFAVLDDPALLYSAPHLDPSRAQEGQTAVKRIREALESHRPTWESINDSPPKTWDSQTPTVLTVDAASLVGPEGPATQTHLNTRLEQALSGAAPFFVALVGPEMTREELASVEKTLPQSSRTSLIALDRETLKRHNALSDNGKEVYIPQVKSVIREQLISKGQLAKGNDFRQEVIVAGQRAHLWLGEILRLLISDNEVTVPAWAILDTMTTREAAPILKNTRPDGTVTFPAQNKRTNIYQKLATDALIRIQS